MNPPGHTVVGSRDGMSVGAGMWGSGVAASWEVSLVCINQARSRTATRSWWGEGGFDQFDGVAGPYHGDGGVDLIDGDGAEDVVGQAADGEVVVASAVAVQFDQVDQQAEGGGDVLLVGVPGAADVFGGV